MATTDHRQVAVDHTRDGRTEAAPRQARDGVPAAHGADRQGHRADRQDRRGARAARRRRKPALVEQFKTVGGALQTQIAGFEAERAGARRCARRRDARSATRPLARARAAWASVGSTATRARRVACRCPPSGSANSWRVPTSPSARSAAGSSSFGRATSERRGAAHRRWFARATPARPVPDSSSSATARSSAEAAGSSVRRPTTSPSTRR